MSVIIRLQNLPWSASSRDIRVFFKGLTIPDGGVHIIGGDNGDAFIAFSSDEDARQAMMLSGRDIHAKPISLLLSSKVEMSQVIADARERLAAESPSPTSDPCLNSGSFLLSEPTKKDDSSTPVETSSFHKMNDDYHLLTQHLHSEKRRRSPSPSPQSWVAKNAAKRGPKEYNTSSHGANSHSDAAVKGDVSRPGPSNDSMIMAKAEEALKALQMMGVIPAFSGQDSTEVTSSLSKSSRMSTVVNEHPQDSANRLIPISLANSDKVVADGRVIDSTTAGTNDGADTRFEGSSSKFCEPLFSNWTVPHYEHNNTTLEYSSSLSFTRNNDSGPPVSNTNFSSKFFPKESRGQNTEADWSERPPPLADSWNEIEEEEEDLVNDLPFGMHHDRPPKSMLPVSPVKTSISAAPIASLEDPTKDVNHEAIAPEADAQKFSGRNEEANCRSYIPTNSFPAQFCSELSTEAVVARSTADPHPAPNIPRYSNTAFPIDSLLPPQRSNPFDVLFEKPFRTSPQKLSVDVDPTDNSRFDRRSTPLSADRRYSGPPSPENSEPRSGVGTGFFVALTNMDWNTDFNGIVEFMKPAIQGSRGIFPCFGLIGKINGNFVAELRSEGDMKTVLAKSGTMWRNRRVHVFRILQRQFDDVEKHFGLRLPYVQIERPPPSAFETSSTSSDQPPFRPFGDAMQSPPLLNRSEFSSRRDGLDSNFPVDRPVVLGQQNYSKPRERDPIINRPPEIIEKREPNKKSPTVFEYNNGFGPAEVEGDFSSCFSDLPKATTEVPLLGKLFEKRSRTEHNKRDMFCADRRSFGKKIQHEPDSERILHDDPFTLDRFADRPVFSDKPGIMGSPPVHQAPNFRWICVVQDPAPRMNFKEVRRCLGAVEPLKDGIHLLNSRKNFSDELILVEFASQPRLHEGMAELKESRIVVGATKIFRVTEKQFEDCVRAYERGNNYILERPPAPVLQHFFIHIANAPKDTKIADLLEFFRPVLPLEIHRLIPPPGNQSSLFIAELLGKSDLAVILASDRKMMNKKVVEIFRIVRYQYEDALTSVQNRNFVPIKRPLQSDLHADDKWYLEYLEGFPLELRSFAYDFQDTRQQKISVRDKDDRRNERFVRVRRSHDKSPKRERRSRSPKFKSDRYRDDRNSRERRDRKITYERRSNARSGRSSGSREKDRWRHNDDEGDDEDEVRVVSIPHNPKTPVGPRSDGKYAVMISGLDSRVAQQHLNQFFAQIGIKPSQVRIVFPPGSTTDGRAFAELSDHEVYRKAFTFEGRLLNDMFRVSVEDVPVNEVNKRILDIRKGRSGATALSNSFSKTSKNIVEVRPLLEGVEPKRPVAVVNPENRSIPSKLPSNSTSTSSILNPDISSSITSTTLSDDAITFTITTTTSTNTESSDSRAAHVDSSETDELRCIRIESAPEDITSAEVEDFFVGRHLVGGGIRIRRESGVAVVEVEFMGRQECDEAMKVEKKLRGSDLVMRQVSKGNAAR